MTTAATSLLGLALPVTGELQGTWGTTVNDSITSLLDTAVAGTTTLSTDADVTLTTTTLAANQARQAILLCSGARTAQRTITAPAQSKIYTIINATTGGFAVKIVGAGPTTGVTIAAGASAQVAWNGSDFIVVGSTTANSLTVSGNLTVNGTTTLTGAATLTANPTLSAGTANGVAYLNGSKVVTTGSALTFDGTNLGIGNSLSGIAGYTVVNAGGTGTSGLYRVNYNNVNVGQFYTDSSSNLYVENVVSGKPIIFATSAGEGMRLTSTGLGIGTSSPGEKLDVAGNVNATLASSVGKIVLRNSSTTSSELHIRPNSGKNGWLSFTEDSVADRWIVGVKNGNGSLFFNTGSVGTNTDRMVLDSSGNLGLGVTPSAADNNFKYVQVGGGGYLGSFYSQNGASQLGLVLNAYYNAGWKYAATASTPASRYQQDSGQHYWYTAPSGTAGNAISFTQAMTLDASGNLMVGTTTQLARANFAESVISGEADVLIGNSAGSGTNNTAALYLSGQNTLVRSAAIKAVIGSSNEHYLAFFTNGAFDTPAERARIDSSGNLLVGYTSSAQGLVGAYQTANANGAYVRCTNASFTNSILEIEADRNTTNNTFYAITYLNNGAGTYKFRVADSGNVTNTNNSYGAISDAKMKTDIVDAGSQWADIKAIRFRKFKMKDDPEQVVQLGVVAQEIEQTSPGLVEEHADRDADGNDLGTTTKSVKTSVLLMKAAVALQEAMARIEQLEAKVAALEAK